MGFQEKLTVLRKVKGITQEELAERLGVSRQAVSKWESGLSMPEVDKIVQISELLGISLDDLLKDGELHSSPAPEVAPMKLGQKDEKRAVEQLRVLGLVLFALCAILSAQIYVLGRISAGMWKLLFLVVFQLLFSLVLIFVPKQFLTLKRYLQGNRKAMFIFGMSFLGIVICIVLAMIFLV